MRPLAEYCKPLPVVTEENRGFWEGAKDHKLLLQRCDVCGERRMAGPNCWSCLSFDYRWVEAGGKGTVYTWTVIHQRFHPAFADDLPYNVAMVELEEGPRLITNLVECANEDIYLGMPVEVVFDDVTDEVTLPKFRPAKDAMQR